MTEDSRIVQAADAQLRALNHLVQRSLKWPRRMIIGLVVTCVFMMGGMATTSVLYVNQRHITASVQRQATATQKGAIEGCLQGNARAMTDQQNWDFFIDFLLKGDTKPADVAKGQFVKDHIAASDKARNCQKAFGK